jgi:hypothetical protein
MNTMLKPLAEAVHSLISPSGWSRWSECPGSVEAEAPYPDTSNSASDWGTAAHEIVQLCLDNNMNPATFLDQVHKGTGIKVDQEMVDAVDVCLTYARQLGGEQYVEQRFNLETWIPGGFGTSDLSVVQKDTGHLDVVDWKFGTGVKVYAEGNGQLICYALGALEELSMFYDIVTVRLHIVQPRLGHVDVWPPADEEPLSLADMLLWGEQVQRAAARALEPGAPRIPGEKQCKFCKASGHCREQAMAIVNEFDDMPEAIEDLSSRPLVARPVDELSPAELGSVLRQKKKVTDWLTAVERQALEMARAGIEIEGMKLVMPNKRDKWADDDEAIKAMRGLMVKGERLRTDDVSSAKPITPAAARKLLTAKQYAKLVETGLVVKPEGDPVLAPESDKRPSVDLDAALEDFSSITASTEN